MNRVRDFSNSLMKPWMDDLFDSTNGMKPLDLAVLMNLAWRADEEGKVPPLSMVSFAEACGIGLSTARRALSERGNLVQSGMVIRRPRFEGELALPTEYQLHWPGRVVN